MTNEMEIKKHATESQDLLSQAERLSVTNSSSYRFADQRCVALKELEILIIADFAGSKKAAHEAHRKIVAQEATHLEPVQQARALLKRKMSAFEQEEEEIRRAKELELLKIEFKRAEEKALGMAAEAEARGNKQAATEILEAPLIVAPVIVESETPKRQTTLRTVWKFIITDQAQIPRKLMMPNQVAIGQIVKALKGATDIPGVEVYQETI